MYFLLSIHIGFLLTDIFEILNCSELISYLSYFFVPKNIFTFHDFQKAEISPYKVYGTNMHL